MTDNKEKYSEFLKKLDYVPLFAEKWWLDAVCPPISQLGKEVHYPTDDWDLILKTDADDNIIAAFPITYRRRYKIIKTIEIPPFTPFLSILVNIPKKLKNTTLYSWEEELNDFFLEKIPQKSILNLLFSGNYNNFLSFKWAGFTIIPEDTFIIDLKNSLEVIEANFKTSVRKNIRKAKNISIVVSEDPTILYSIYEKRTLELGNKILHSLHFWSSLYEKIKLNNAGEILIAKDQEGRIHAAICIVWDKKYAYFLTGRADGDLRTSGAMSMLFFEAIKRAKNRGLYFFDFTGTATASISKFKANFGGERINQFRLSKYNTSWQFLYTIKNLLKK